MTPPSPRVALTPPPPLCARCLQAGTLVRGDAALALVRDDVPRFVCRAGLKLDWALEVSEARLAPPILEARRYSLH